VIGNKKSLINALKFTRKMQIRLLLTGAVCCWYSVQCWNDEDVFFVSKRMLLRRPG